MRITAFSPERYGNRETPSIGLCNPSSGMSNASTTVAKMSSEEVSPVKRWSRLKRSPQTTKNGTRCPPSNLFPLKPFNGRLEDWLVVEPPLSLKKNIIVLSNLPAAFSSSTILPTPRSSAYIIAAYFWRGCPSKRAKSSSIASLGEWGAVKDIYSIKGCSLSVTNSCALEASSSVK